MDYVRSIGIGLVVAIAVGYAVALASLTPYLALALGGLVGALLRHEEDGRAAAAGFALTAVFLFLPNYGLPIGLAMLGYTVARHT